MKRSEFPVFVFKCEHYICIFYVIHTRGLVLTANCFCQAKSKRQKTIFCSGWKLLWF